MASTWASGFTPSVPNDPSYGLDRRSTVCERYTADLEVQRRFCLCNWDMYGFGGIRYASVNNDRTLLSTNSFDGPDLSAASFAGQQFNGAGMTFGMFGTRPIWCDDSPLKTVHCQPLLIAMGQRCRGGANDGHEHRRGRYA